jgi:hypothetical protein
MKGTERADGLRERGDRMALEDCVVAFIPIIWYSY